MEAENRQLVTKAEAIRRAFTTKKAMLVARRGGPDPDVSQVAWLYDLAVLAPDGAASEVGVLYGGSFVCWAAARVGRGDLVAVDNWSSRVQAEPRRRFVANVQRYDLDVQIFDANSWDAPALIQGDVAFCFIDSKHAHDGIARDVPVWADRMMPGGIIAFHDYGVPNPSVAVKAVVDMWDYFTQWEEGGKWDRLGLVGSTIAFRRPAE